jgi:hypothetical protein
VTAARSVELDPLWTDLGGDAARLALVHEGGPAPALPSVYDVTGPRLPIDLVAVIALYTLASLTRPRRIGAAVLALTLLALYALSLATALGIGQPEPSHSKGSVLLASP